MNQIKTPGVYVREISTLPPSVAQVATAIPAFIGYTPNHFTTEPTRITSLKEFEAKFGANGVYAPVDTYDIEIKANGSLEQKSSSTVLPSNLYYSLQMFYANGGGTCYIVSVGADTTDILVDSATEKAKMTSVFTLLEEYDEPTLIVMPGAYKLAVTDASDVYKAALVHCSKMQDRFAVIDVHHTDGNSIEQDKTEFHTNIGVNNLSYGASYYPALDTSLARTVDDSKVTISYEANSGSFHNDTLNILKEGKTGTEPDTALYARIQSYIQEQNPVVLPPSAAIAGVYAAVDNSRGVWKAPANVSLNAVVSPTIKITNEAQDNLNVPANGKAINAIRTFTGKGTLVWGARTLDGNSREWKYVNVRRLYINVEESLQKALEPFVFEANDANTWAKVRGLASSFLTTLWKQGALVGPTVSDAFFVKIGLGETMSPDDVLDGIMNVEIGLAASRPAEFIVLKFSHKVQEA